MMNSAAYLECDISYIAPSAYVPPDDGLPPRSSNGVDHEDPYVKLVQGSLQKLDQQKVSSGREDSKKAERRK